MWKRISMLLLSAVFLTACSGVTKEQKELYEGIQSKVKALMSDLNKSTIVAKITEYDKEDMAKMKFIKDNSAKDFSKEYGLEGEALTKELNRVSKKVDQLTKGAEIEESLRDGTIVKKVGEELKIELNKLADSIKNINLEELFSDTTVTN